jgi:hypothetical protein
LSGTILIQARYVTDATKIITESYSLHTAEENSPDDIIDLTGSPDPELEGKYLV